MLLVAANTPNLKLFMYQSFMLSGCALYFFSHTSTSAVLIQLEEKLD